LVNLISADVSSSTFLSNFRVPLHAFAPNYRIYGIDRHSTCDKVLPAAYAFILAQDLQD
jgi:hypothetical protein